MKLFLTMLFFSSLLAAQDQQLDALKRYLLIQHLTSADNRIKLSDISGRLEYIRSVSDSTLAVRKGPELKHYFDSHGYSFYSFYDTPDCDHCTYLKILAVDSSNWVFEVSDPLSFVNGIVREMQSPDSSAFLRLIRLYDKLNLPHFDGHFVEDYDRSIFGTKVAFWDFYTVSRINGGFQLLKLLKSTYDGTTETYAFRYTLVLDKFDVKKNLRTRVYE